MDGTFINILTMLGVGIAAGSLGALLSGWVIGTREKLQNQREQERMLTIMSFNHSVELALSEVKSLSTVDRAVVLKVHNGGSKLEAGITKYASVHHEPKNSLQPYMKDRIKHRELTSGHKQLLYKVATNKILIRNTADLEPSEIKRILDADDITSTVFFEAAETPHTYYYGILGTTSDPTKFTLPDNYVKLEAHISSIRNLYAELKGRGMLH